MSEPTPLQKQLIIDALQAKLNSYQNTADRTEEDRIRRVLARNPIESVARGLGSETSMLPFNATLGLYGLGSEGYKWLTNTLGHPTGVGLPGGDAALKVWNEGIDLPFTDVNFGGRVHVNDAYDITTDPQDYADASGRALTGLIPLPGSRVGSVAGLLGKGALASKSVQAGLKVAEATGFGLLSRTLPSAAVSVGIPMAIDTFAGIPAGEDVRKKIREQDAEYKVAGETVIKGETFKTIPSPAAIEAQNDSRNLQNWLIGAGAMLAGGAGVRTVFRNSDTARKLAKATLSHSDAGLYESLRKAGLDEDQVNRFYDSYRTTITPQALSARAVEHLRSGVLPNSLIRTKPMAKHLETLGRLPKEQMEAYHELMTAYTRLDDMNAQKRYAMKRSDGTEITRAEIISRINVLKQDELVAGLVDEAHDYYRNFRKYMHEAGMIDTKTWRQWEDTRKHYSPLARAIDDEMVSADSTQVRAKLDSSDVLRYGSEENPAFLHERYAATQIRRVENNRVRRQLLDKLKVLDDVEQVSKKHQGDPDVLTIIRDGKTEYYKVKDAMLRQSLEFNPLRTLPLMRFGRRLMTEFTTGRAAPWFAPISAMYETGTMLLTLPKGARGGILDEYMAEYAPRLARKLPDAPGFNYIKPKIAKAKLGRLDPTLPLAGVTGTGKHLYAESMQGFSRMVETSLRTNTGLPAALAKKLGPAFETQLKHMADGAANAYLRTSLHQAQRYGGGNAVYLEETLSGTGAVPPALNDLAPHLARKMPANSYNKFMNKFKSSTGARIYNTLLTAIHNGTRLQYMASNRPRDAMGAIIIPDEGMDMRALDASIADANKVASDMRASTGDATIRAGVSKKELKTDTVAEKAATRVGRLNQAAADAIPYYNQFTQVTSRHAQAMKENPTGYATGLMMTGGYTLGMVEFAIGDNKQAQHKYWKEWTTEQRGRFIPLAFDDNGDPIALWAVSPEVSVLVSPLLEMYGIGMGYQAANPSEMALMQEASRDILDVNNLERIGLASLDAARHRVAPSMMPTTVQGAVQGAAVMGNMLGADINIPTMQEMPFGGGRVGSFTTNELGPEGKTALRDSTEKFIQTMLGSASQIVMAGALGYLNSRGENESITQSMIDAGDRMVTAATAVTKTPYANIWKSPMPGQQDVYLDRRVKKTMADIQRIMDDKALTRRPGATAIEGDRNARWLNQQFNIKGTELEVVHNNMEPYHYWLRTIYQPQYKKYSEDIAAVRANNKLSTRTRTQLLQHYQQGKTALNTEAAVQIDKAEQHLTKVLGRPFSFHNTFSADDGDPARLGKTWLGNPPK